jgi:hypothetical protein
MGRPVCAAYISRNAEITRKYQEGSSLLDLTEEYGLSNRRLRDLVQKQGIELRPGPDHKRSHYERRSKSNVLVAVGARLHAHRMHLGLSLAEYANLLGLAETRLYDALQGLYDWKFNELVRAARVLSLDLENFLKPPSGLNG